MSVTIGAAPEKDRRSPPHRPAQLGEDRCGAVRGASPFSAAYPLRGGYFPADMDWDSPELVSAVLEELDVGSLGLLGELQQRADTAPGGPQEAGFGFEEFRKAQALYWLALSPYAEEDDFVQKLVGCFAPDQTNEELVANVNAAFGTDIDPEEFEKFLATTASDMVAIGSVAKQAHKKQARFGSPKGFPTSPFALFLVCETKEKARPVYGI